MFFYVRQTAFFVSIRPLLALFCIFLSTAFLHAEEVLVNEIRAILYHKSGSVPLTNSDLRALDGHVVTLREAVLRQLMMVHGQQFAQVSDDDVEKMIAELQKANGLSRDGMMHAFEAAGFTKEEGMLELKRQQIVSQVLEVRVRSDKRLIIQKYDVEEYNREHPAFAESIYTLQQVCAPAEGSEHREFTADELKGFAWEAPFDVKESELADDKHFIIDAAIDSIVGRDRVAEGLELTRLVKKVPGRLLTLEERYDEIMDTLRRQRFFTVLREFQASLLKDASIWFSHPEDRDAVMAEPEDGAEDRIPQ
ncbi:MAG: hypothetical protein M1549_01725 [Candidatus Dependentiae bacterium]|nr:hypothetical protein [Candidatus Dependentiae bacterium]